MSEIYRPRIRSAAHTIPWAQALKIAPADLDPLTLISEDPAIRQRSEMVVRALLRNNLHACGDDVDLSAPTYVAGRVVSDAENYGILMNRMHEIAREEVHSYIQDKPKRNVQIIASLRQGPKDGYTPSPGETIEDVVAFLMPQIKAALANGATPVVEATTT